MNRQKILARAAVLKLQLEVARAFAAVMEFDGSAPVGTIDEVVRGLLKRIRELQRGQA